MTPKEYREKIELEVMNLHQICNLKVSAGEVDWVTMYLENNEWGLAAETILHYIDVDKLGEADPRVESLAKELQSTLDMAAQFKGTPFRDFF